MLDKLGSKLTQQGLKLRQIPKTTKPFQGWRKPAKLELFKRSIMKNITLELNANDQIILSSPYDADLIEDIKSIPQSHRQWKTPSWIITPGQFDETETIEQYLERICNHHAARLGCNFINKVGKSTLEIAKQVAQSNLKKYQQFTALLAQLPANSIALTLAPDRANITLNTHLGTDAWKELKDVVDVDDRRNWSIKSTDRQIITIWDSPAIANQPLITITPVGIEHDELSVGVDATNRKYLYKLGKGGNGKPGIVDGTIAQTVDLTEKITTMIRCNEVDWEEIANYNLQDDFATQFYKSNQINSYTDTYHCHETKYNYRSYRHYRQANIDWIEQNYEKLMAIGIDTKPYAIKFSELKAQLNQKIIDLHTSDTSNAIATCESQLATLGKDILIDLATKHGTTIKPSWSRAKIVAAMNIHQDYAIAYLKIPAQPTLK